MTRNQTIQIGSGQKNILFTLQPGVIYPDWIREVMAETGKECNWMIRKHPVYDATQEKLIRAVRGLQNVSVDGVSDIMLEKLLMHTDLHVTNHSAVVMDAAEFGVKSVIFGAEYRELFRKEEDAGFVRFAADKEEMEQVIRSFAGGTRTGQQSRRDHSPEKKREFLRRNIRAQTVIADHEQPEH